MSDVTPLYTPKPHRPMRVAAFMSGSGTNLVKLLEARGSSGGRYAVAVIFTDNEASRAGEIARESGIPLIVEDIKAFYRSRGMRSRRDLSLRPDFDRGACRALAPFEVDLIVLAGYMSILTDPLLEAYEARIINVHPADLSILKDGRRAFTGAHSVRDGLLAGLSELRSSTHIVRREVDYGEILMVSEPVPVTLPEGVTAQALASPENRRLLDAVAAEHQEALKRRGDWVVLPLTVDWISRGRFGLSADGTLTLDGKPCPEGVRLDERGPDG